jgi:hypothetical protein
MKETTWRRLTSPDLRSVRGKVSNRKLWLFTVDCCRRIWELFPSEACRNVVDVLERYADGAASEEELETAAEDGWFSDTDPGYPYDLNTSAYARTVIKHAPDAQDGWNAADGAIEWVRAAAIAAGTYTPEEELRAQANILRDICGPLLFRSVAIDPAWLVWNNGTVVKIAQAIYDERAFDRLPIIADALEDAGCTDPDILHHCRQSGEHVRGCWVVDLLLGQE